MFAHQRPITVLYLDTSHIFSGAESSLITLLKHLDRDIFKPILCFLYPQPHHNRYIMADTEIRYLTNGAKGWMGSGYWKCLPRGSDFLRRIILGRLLALIAKKECVDIVHVNLLWPKPFWFLWWAKSSGFPTIGHARSYVREKPLPPRKVQKACDAIIHVSKLVQEEAAKIFDHPRSYQIYNPIDMDAYQSAYNKQQAKQILGLNPDLRIISSVGLLSPHKGHDIAIMAFSEIAKITDDVNLYIAGGGSNLEKQRLEKIAHQYGVSDRVIFSGKQLDNIQDVYASSEFVYSLTKCGEAFGRVPLEAGSAGKPVLVNSLGAAPELVVNEKSGYLVNPTDLERIIRISIKLLKNRDLCQNIGTFAKHHIKLNFAPEQIAAAVEKVYIETVNASR